MVNIAVASLAFSAGLISFLNPCGFALLPVYITYYFKHEKMEKSSLWKRIFFGLILGIMVSLGFAFVFSIIGLIVGFAGNALLKYIGWLDFSIGILLVVIGLSYLFNLKRRINLNKISGLGEKLKSANIKNKFLSFFFYGMGFALASLGCTLPIFMLVVTAALKAGNIFSSLTVFLIYTFGMSLFMIGFSVSVALSKTVIEQKLKKIMPYLNKIGPIIVLAAGLYLIYNQVVFGKLFG